MQYDYQYDEEGNRILRTDRGTSATTSYAWDHRNRLTRVEIRNQAGTLTEAIDYTYDAFDRRIRKAVDTDGDLDPDVEQRFIYDSLAKLDGPVGAEDVVLVFGSHPTLPLQRLLHGNAVDQILAIEDMTEAIGPDRVRWALTDNLGSVRAVADNDGNVDNHLTFGAFGQYNAESDASIDFLYGFTGREWDADVGLYYYRARWYDPEVGRFLSEDPLGFEAGDVNLTRYVGNSPNEMTDPDGRQQYGVDWANEV